MSKRNRFWELMFLFKIGLSRLISKLSLISRKTLLFLFAKIANSLKDGILLQFKRWLQIVLSFNGLIFLNVTVAILLCFPDLTFKLLFVTGKIGRFYRQIYLEIIHNAVVYNRNVSNSPIFFLIIFHFSL